MDKMAGLSKAFVDGIRTSLESDKPEIVAKTLQQISPLESDERVNPELLRELKGTLLAIVLDTDRPEDRKAPRQPTNRESAAAALARVGDDGIELLLPELKNADSQIALNAFLGISVIISHSFLGVHLPESLHKDNVVAHGLPRNFAELNVPKEFNFSQTVKGRLAEALRDFVRRLDDQEDRKGLEFGSRDTHDMLIEQAQDLISDLLWVIRIGAL